MTGAVRRPRPAPAPPPPAADGDLISAHLKIMRLAGKSPGYVAARRRALIRLAAALRGRPLAAAARRDLLAWRESLQYTPDAIQVAVSHVRSFYTWLHEEGYRPDNPALRLPVPPRTRRLPRPIAEDDLTTALAGADPAMRMMLVLAGWLGLRCCEIAGLRWEAVRLDGDFPALLVIAESTKGGRKERMIPLSESPWVVAEFRAYGPRRSGWVIPRLDGNAGPNAPHRISKRIAEYLRACGSTATAHQGRHRAATMVQRARHDLRLTQEFLGHSSPATTQVYTLVDRVDMAGAVGAIPVPS